MTEKDVGFLFHVASNVNRAGNDDAYKLLSSYYLMRIKQLYNGYGLPKVFSSTIRCSRCCLEWSRNTEIKLKTRRLSKKQRQKIKKLENLNCNENRKPVLHGIEMEQICTFCKQGTTTILKKPKRNKIQIENSKKVLNNNGKQMNSVYKTNTINQISKVNNVNKQPHNSKTGISCNKPKVKNNPAINVYSKAYEVFSLKNEKNILSSSIIEPTKVIKNNKRKKDKYAGLCRKAVLAAAKIKEDKQKNNKLNLFLKPASG